MALRNKAACSAFERYNRYGAGELTAKTIIEASDVAHGLPEILFRSDRIEVRRIVAGDARHQVVTFESYHDDTGFERAGFGQTFFENAGFTGIHVLTAGNDWYQYPEIDMVLALIRKAVVRADRVLAYGSSMGGYAAVRFADAISATQVLSLSPQYSIDPRRMSADRRWWWDQRRIAFIPEHNGPITCQADVVVAYDPTLEMDSLHAELIGHDVRARFLRLDYAGHPVTTVLSELQLLQKMAIDFVTGPLDLDAVQTEFRARREEASMWLAEYASRLPDGSKTLAGEYAARAVALAPANASVQFQYGMRLHDLGRYDEAIAAYELAVGLSPHPIFIMSLSRALFFAGRLSDAHARAEQALAERSFDSEYFRWAARVRQAMGDRAGAYDYARSAFRLARTPRNLWSMLCRAVDRIVRR